MWRFFARTHALRTWQLLPARTSHARVLFARHTPHPHSHFKIFYIANKILESGRYGINLSWSADKYAEYIYTHYSSEDQSIMTIVFCKIPVSS